MLGVYDSKYPPRDPPPPETLHLKLPATQGKPHGTLAPAELQEEVGLDDAALREGRPERAAGDLEAGRRRAGTHQIPQKSRSKPS